MFSIRPFQPVDAHTWKGYTQKLAFYVMFLLHAVRGVICMRHANKYTIYYLNVYNAHLFSNCTIQMETYDANKIISFTNMTGKKATLKDTSVYSVLRIMLFAWLYLRVGITASFH
jgi:hypothetical protein